MEGNNQTSNRLLIGSVLIIFLVLLTLFFVERNENSKLKEMILNSKIQVTDTKIDSVKSVSESDKKTIVINSKKSVEKSKQLIKKISNDKIKITDTTYTAMCKYITNYK